MLRLLTRCLSGGSFPLLLVLSVMLAAAGGAHAQGFPTRPVRIIVPFPPGGSADIFSRLIGQKLSEDWGQPVLIDNRPGAGTVVGTQAAARAPADGYTVLVMANSFTINSSLRSNLPYDITRDFAPITGLVNSPNVIVVNPAVPANSLAELISLARSKPGKLTYSAIGPGGTQHVAGEMLKLAERIDLTYVPYPGGAPAVLAAVGGHVDVAIANISEIMQQVDAGKLRALAVTTLERDPTLKAVPTVAESGIADYQVVTWWGLVAPAGTPTTAIAAISDAVARVLKNPDVRARLIQQGLYPAPSSPAQFDAHIRSETARYAKVVKEANIKAE